MSRPLGQRTAQISTMTSVGLASSSPSRRGSLRLRQWIQVCLRALLTCASAMPRQVLTPQVILPGGPADASGDLAVGDAILQIEGATSPLSPIDVDPPHFPGSDRHQRVRKEAAGGHGFAYWARRHTGPRLPHPPPPLPAPPPCYNYSHYHCH
eukprot:1657977-Rhodomonas_salina.2